MQFWSPEVRELEPYVPGEQPKIQNLLKLNTNENPYPPSPNVVAAVQAVLANQADALRLYPDPDASVLKQAIAKQQQVDVSQVFVGNGSDEVLAHIFKAFFIQAEPILYPDISYSFYPVYSQFFGIQTQQMPLNDDFEINVADYQQPNGGIIIANPNAPTSIALGVAQIEQILQVNPNRVVVIDEAYVDFGGESVVPLTKKYDNLLVVQTFSKSRSLAGGRLGYAIGSEGLIADLNKIRNSTNPYNVDSLTKAVGLACLEEQDYYDNNCKKIVATREYTAQELQKLGFEMPESRTNFLFARHPKLAGKQLYLDLKARGILVRHFDMPRILDYNRITIGTPEQMETLLKTLREMI